MFCIGKNLLVILFCLLVSCVSNHRISDADLQSLENTRSEYFAASDDTVRFELANKLINDALEYKNDRYTATGYFLLMQYYQKKVMAGESYRDSVYYYYNIANRYYEKSGYEMGLVNSRYSQVHTLMMEGSVYVALDEAMKSYERFKNSEDEGVLFFINWTLCVAYIGIERTEDKYENLFFHLDKSLYHLERWSKTNEANKIQSSNYYPTILKIYFQLYIYLQEYEKALYYCNLFKDFAEKDTVKSDDEINYLKFEADCMYTNVFSQMGIIDKAQPFFEKMKYKYENPDFNIYPFSFIIYYEAAISYYRKMKDYDKVFENVALLGKALSEYYGYEDWLTFLKLVSDINIEKKDYLSVIDVKDETINYIDSINKVFLLRQIDYVKKNSQMELEVKIAKEKIHELNYVRGIAISLGLVCILLVISIYLKMRNNKMLKEKNETILMQYRDIDKYINEINNLTDHLKDTEERNNTRELTLFEKIEKHMDDTRAYSNPSITRETLAIELGTNRQYLTQAIHDNKGQSFMEYINDLRLEYARRLLFDQPELTVDSVCGMSGFSTRSTFYRLFKQKYGITPTEVRDLNPPQD